ncbi:unnamed protein product (macronuclear) [Paramecium tetraurelia]|uniref:Uncharacterized protein n=1 Tax=Paramecium tetraurelia TaxID=5888 RepID=A0BJC7_PARTE|nr:uncharacterized protein GSPATT00005017001 [Paramecium tetraurelia]CAK58644.1 unnamed protein product [Paramecium tetraurelia]|eukprot:XP_001426042.1 hypothetical protein (macronuclear) [Paramecium tetraurelia strain d4-2]
MTESFRTRKSSYVKTCQHLLLNKVNFPSQNLIITRLNCIKPQELPKAQQKLYPKNLKQDKIGSDSEPSCFITSLAKLCNLENTQTQNVLQKRAQQRYQYGYVQGSMDQGNLIRVKSNSIRPRYFSNDFLTDRTMRSSVSPNKKKVRFYEKIEYWVLNKDRKFECDFRYFETMKLQ